MLALGPALARFREDFLFELTVEEFGDLKSQLATSSWGGRRKLPLAVTRHGTIPAATVRNTPCALEVTVCVVRALVKPRGLVGSHRELARRLDERLQERSAPRSQLATLGAASAGAPAEGSIASTWWPSA